MTNKDVICIVAWVAFSFLMGFLGLFLHKKQSKKSGLIKVGDKVYISGEIFSEAEVLEADDEYLIIKTRVPRMKANIKK